MAFFDNLLWKLLSPKLHNIECKLDAIIARQEQDRAVFKTNLGHVFGKLIRLENLGEKIMAVAQEVKDVLAKVDTETTIVGDNVKALLARVKNTMTDAEVAEIKSIGMAISDRLHVIGSDAANPVPPEPPPLAAARRKL